MITTKNKYHNPSVNIIRDLNREINYLPTTNAQLVYDEILNHYTKGTRSFTLVGAYGTGKSSFLWAFEKNLNHKASLFSNTTKFSIEKEYEIIPIVGEYKSLTASCAEYFGLNTNDSSDKILKEFEKKYKTLKKNGKGLVIIVDEFGKFLEYSSKNLPESELYFLQQLAEFANDLDKEILFITTLHQGFNSYANQLTKYQKQEWDKVSGRFVELAFNEPVEQLLVLAAEKLNNPENKVGAELTELFETIKVTRTFPLKNNLDIEICRQLLPFDLIAAGILTLSLQRYGQNQRSLFSFVDSDSHLSIHDYDKAQNPFYNLACVYDYLNFNYYSFLITKGNPDYFQWASINSALERCEGIFKEEFGDIQKLIKTIGLLSLFSNKGAIIDKGFLKAYSKFCLGIQNADKLIKELETNKIILYSSYNQRFKLTEGTDLNIELAIDAAGNLIQQAGNVVDLLQRYFDFPYLLAKEVFYETGTPRFFEFTLSDEPKNNIPEGETDGFINLVFSEALTDIDLEIYSKNVPNAILFGLYNNTSNIKKLLYEIEKVNKVIDDNKDDKVAVKELSAILEHNKNLLNHYIFDNLYNSSHVSWFYKGKNISISSSKELNRQLSIICKNVYPGTPVLRNELFNKTRISSNISIARRNYIDRLINRHDEENFGFESELFPPEKTIYLSLLKKTGIHHSTSGTYSLGKPKDTSFKVIWETGVNFIESAKNGRRKISELIEQYQSRPVKLKQGFVDFWLPYISIYS